MGHISSTVRTSQSPRSGSWAGLQFCTLAIQTKTPEKAYIDNSSSFQNNLQHYIFYLTHHSDVSIVCRLSVCHYEVSLLGGIKKMPREHTGPATYTVGKGSIIYLVFTETLTDYV